MVPSREDINRWIEWRWRDHGSRVVSVKEGTYGLVWIVELAPDTRPPRFALKGFDSGKASKAPHGDARALFERELDKWLRLGSHVNVLPALGLELVPPDGDTRRATNAERAYPLVRMPFMERTLSDWIGKPQPSIEDRLAAVAQLCNGLTWIYERGVSGHGDLKPENVLINNLRLLRDQGGPSKPSLPTWIVKVADFGWADIWEDLEGPEFARKAYRPYLAPERLDGEVRGAASDIFAVGVIAVELIAGCHPAGQPTHKVNDWGDRKYSKWALGGSRLTSDTVPLDIRGLLDSCLAPQAGDRPSPREVIDRLCRAVNGGLGYDLKTTLDLWTKHARQSHNHVRRRWELQELSRLGGDRLDDGIERLERDFSVSPFLRSPVAVADWLTAGRSLTRLLLRRGSSGDRERAGDAALTILRFVVNHFGEVDLRYELYGLPLTTELAIPDLEATEVMLEFGAHAEGVLSNLGRDGEAEVSQLREKLRELWARSQPTLEEFIERILLPDIEREEKPDGDGSAEP